MASWGVQYPEEDPFALFPIQEQWNDPGAPRSVPRWVAAMAYAAYVHEGGRGQTLSQLAQRGGFGPGEMDKLFPRWREFASAATPEAPHGR